MNPVIWVMLILAGLLGFSLSRIWAQGLTWATAKRWLLTVVLALLIIGVFMASFFYANRKGAPHELLVKMDEYPSDGGDSIRNRD